MAGKRSGSLVLNEPDPSFGDDVTFTVTSNVDRTWVRVRFVQGAESGVIGYGFVTNGVSAPITLSGTSGQGWNSGAATCFADLIYMNQQWQEQVLATVEFEVAA